METIEVATANAAAANAWTLVSLRRKKGTATNPNTPAVACSSNATTDNAAACSSNAIADANAAVVWGLARDEGPEDTSNLDVVLGNNAVKTNRAIA